MKTVAIYGVGLIGGSFALALRRSGYTGQILGVSSSGTIAEAVRLGVVDRGAEADEAAYLADLIYLAQPIREILKTIEWLSGRLKPGALVTDVGSTKVEIMDVATRVLGASSFLGGHPMAGKELRGVGAAEAGLFEGRTYFLCVRDQAVLDHPVAEQLVDHLENFGARPVLLEPAEHDRLVSLTSHLPQMASTALASCLSKVLEPNSARNGAGPGLGDMTRLAQSSYELWADILFTNVNSIDRALALYIAELQEIRAALGHTDVGATFERAANFSGLVRKPRP
jgi:prephenate dehydrogenase